MDLIQEAFVAERSEPPSREPSNNNTALHCTIEAGKTDILRVLLQEDHESIDHVNRYLGVPLHIVSVKGNFHALTQLINFNAELHLKDMWGDTPLSLAQSDNHWPVVTGLIGQDSEIDQQKIDIKKTIFAAIE